MTSHNDSKSTLKYHKIHLLSPNSAEETQMPNTTCLLTPLKKSYLNLNPLSDTIQAFQKDCQARLNYPNDQECITLNKFTNSRLAFNLVGDLTMSLHKRWSLCKISCLNKSESWSMKRVSFATKTSKRGTGLPWCSVRWLLKHFNRAKTNHVITKHNGKLFCTRINWVGSRIRLLHTLQQ